MFCVYKQAHSEVCLAIAKAAGEQHSSTKRKGGLSRSKTVPFALPDLLGTGRDVVIRRVV